MKYFLINLLPDRIAWLFSRPYVAGDSIDKALKKVDDLWRLGKMSTVDLLGEAVSNKEEIDQMTNIYLELIEKLSGRTEYASVSVKPTAIGITISKELCIENLKKLLLKAEKNSVLITVDMEDSTLTTVTLEMYSELLKEFPSLGTVLQTRLFRTKDDIENLLPENSRVRLCIGIYLESPDIALTNKKEMKEKILENSKYLLEKNVYLEVATHDEKTINSVVSYFEEKNIDKRNVEFQFLLGVPRSKIHQDLMDKGYKIRLYTPFSTHWKYGTAYVKRRFIENPNMGIYVAKNLLVNKWVQLLIAIFIFILILFIASNSFS
ncbi:MAG: proline dehydrogenase family protein [Candidatus Hodarchaeales archaeon]|jgi:proline dehydrogenase